MSTKILGMDMHNQKEIIGIGLGLKDKLIVTSTRGFKNLYFKDILYIEAFAGNYCVIYLKDGSNELVTRALSCLEKVLPDELFYRINRSHLINLSFVKSYTNVLREIRLYRHEVVLTLSIRRVGAFRKRIYKLGEC